MSRFHPNRITRREALVAADNSSLEASRIAAAGDLVALLAHAAIKKLGGTIKLTKDELFAARNLTLTGGVENDEAVFTVKEQSNLVTPDGEPVK